MTDSDIRKQQATALLDVHEARIRLNNEKKRITDVTQDLADIAASLKVNPNYFFESTLGAARGEVRGVVKIVDDPRTKQALNYDAILAALNELATAERALTDATTAARSLGVSPD